MANPNQTHQQSLYTLQVHAAAEPSLDTQKTQSEMMIGEHNRPNAILHVSPWSLMGDPPSATCLPYPLTGGDFSDGNATAGGDLSDYNLVLSALQRYLPSNEAAIDDIASGDLSGALESDFPVDAFSSDQFRMFEFKVRRCARGRSHDWTDCPYAHPGEKARRRDPRKYHYSGTACADFRKGSCRKGDACEFAHGVFECWLHPARYRTQPCKDGTNCRRRVCFFAHTQEQLRVLPQQSPVPGTSAAELYDGSPLRQALDARAFPYASSPGSGSISPPESPPMSPITTHPLSRSMGSNSVTEMVSSLRKLHLSKMKSFPSSWGVQAASPTGFGSPSPRGPILPPGSYSLPSTPTRTATRPGLVGCLEFWEECCEEEAGVEMERVDSGRNLRATMFEKLSKENSLDRVDGGHSATTCGPDVGWVSELVNYMINYQPP